MDNNRSWRITFIRPVINVETKLLKYDIYMVNFIFLIVSVLLKGETVLQVQLLRSAGRFHRIATVLTHLQVYLHEHSLQNVRF